MTAALEETDFDHLLRLRLVVGRFGEMDNARWWNTKGLLGRLGTIALTRGFPKSHAFAQARAVFATATARCREVFDPPGRITLWNLPATVEDQFETRWAEWTEQEAEWPDFFLKLQSVEGTDLLATMLYLGVIGEKDAEEAKKLRRAADNRAVPLPGTYELSKETLTLLAAGFFRGEPGQPAIPYAKLEET